MVVLLNLGAGARHIRERMEREVDGLHVPHLFEIEVLNALRHHALRRGISERRSLELLEDLATMSISRYAHTAMLPRIWELRDNVSAYDAAYIALAETLEAPLITRDARLARAPGIRATVEVYG